MDKLLMKRSLILYKNMLRDKVIVVKLTNFYQYSV